MLQNWKHNLVLFIQATTGATLSVFAWAALVAVSTLTAFVFLCVALYDWVALQLNGFFAGLIVAGFFLAVALIAALASMMARRRAKARAILERAARAQAPSRLVDPRIIGIAVQAGRRFGWQRVLPLAVLAVVTAQWARAYQMRANDGGQ
ncbi:MAG TPA: hypothetical protein VGG11_13410 [Xanthobacteraceae bacterium]